MIKNNLQYYLDLRRDDIDPEIFGTALAVKHISVLIAKGGSEFGRPEWDCSLHPLHLQIFLVHAVETKQQTKRFEQEWHSLQKLVPHIKIAWKKGQTYFQNDLARVKSSQEEMEYLSTIDFGGRLLRLGDSQEHISEQFHASSLIEQWMNVSLEAYFIEELQEDG